MSPRRGGRAAIAFTTSKFSHCPDCVLPVERWVGRFGNEEVCVIGSGPLSPWPGARRVKLDEGAIRLLYGKPGPRVSHAGASKSPPCTNTRESRG